MQANKWKYVVAGFIAGIGLSVLAYFFLPEFQGKADQVAVAELSTPSDPMQQTSPAPSTAAILEESKTQTELPSKAESHGPAVAAKQLSKPSSPFPQRAGLKRQPNTSVPPAVTDSGREPHQEIASQPPSWLESHSETSTTKQLETGSTSPQEISSQQPEAKPRIRLTPSPGAAQMTPATPTRQPRTVTIPAGTILAVRLAERLHSDYLKPGDTFVAYLDEPLIVDNLVIAEKGAQVTGRVVAAQPAGKVKARALVELELVSLRTSDGQNVAIRTSTFRAEADPSVKEDAVKIGVLSGIGAAIGAIAGGGKGAAIGAAAGAGAGAGTVLATRGKAVEIPAETRLSFRLSQPVTITEKVE